MQNYRFKNLNIRHEGQDYLVNGIAYYIIEDYDEDGKEAFFEKVELYDILGKQGYILPEKTPEVVRYFEEIVQAHLNQDSTLCRNLGYKL